MKKRDEIENIDSADNVYIDAAVPGNNADITEMAIVENQKNGDQCFRGNLSKQAW